MPNRARFLVWLLLAFAPAATTATMGCSGSPGAGPEQTVELSMKEYTFNGVNPTLRFKPGERVRFIVTNDESTNVLHNFRIVGMDVECGPPMKPGERREVIVTIPKSGEFAYTCCTHPGMGGKMMVVKK
jgi:plastocyanin